MSPDEEVKLRIKLRYKFARQLLAAALSEAAHGAGSALPYVGSADRLKTITSHAKVLAEGVLEGSGA